MRPFNSLATSAAGFLTRPALGSDIPSVLQRNPLASTAALALLLLDAGILKEKDWRCSRLNLAKQCERALTHWINERTKGLRCIRPSFRLSVGNNIPYYAFHQTNGVQNDLLEIAWFVESSDEYIVGPQIERLENVKKGLGHAALRALSEYSWNSFPIMLCQQQLGLAQHVLWGGEDSVEDYIEGMGIDADDAASIREESISRAEIIAQTPEHILNSYKWKMPKQGALRLIERRCPDALAREVAAILRLLKETPELRNYHETLEEDGGDFYGFCAFVRWSENDYTIELAERLTEYEMNGGVGYDLCGFHSLPLSDLDTFVQWMHEMDGLFAVTRLLDRLIWLLSGASSPYALNTQESSSHD